MNKTEKNLFYIKIMSSLIEHHLSNSNEYFNILNAIKFKGINNIKDIPFIPVGLFKSMELKSISKDNVYKIVTSSGTEGQKVSRIFLDKNNAANQLKVLAKVISHFTENKRLPMLIIDSPSIIRDRNLFTARGAAITGFSVIGTDITYALDENMELNFSVIDNFFKKYKDTGTIVFGFTFVVWQNFIKVLQKENYKLMIRNSFLIHGGGWKKLINISVDNSSFKKEIKNCCNIDRVHNYYGMAEQTGSIFVECEYGYFHCSIFSDIIIRNPITFDICRIGEEGLIQLLSILPTSYPGHSILSEDIGVLIGEDDCLCGRLGKYFLIRGRISEADIRGCSDVLSS